MSEEKYNGWTNQATWKVAVRCDSLDSVNLYKETLESVDIDNDDLINEAVKYFYDDVNWHELENAEWPEE